MCGRGSAEVKLCKKTYNDEALPLLELALLGINRSAQGSRREKASPILHAFCSTHAFIHSCRRESRMFRQVNDPVRNIQKVFYAPWSRSKLGAR